MQPKPCEHCGAVVIRRSRGRFCGQECFLAHIRADPSMHSECPTCKKQFRQRLRSLPRTFCSLRCVRNKKRAHPSPLMKPRELKLCGTCRKPFEFCPTGWTKDRRFCSNECSRVYVSEVRRMPSAARDRFAHRRLAGRCERCGWAKEIRVLQVHHMDHNKLNDSPENWEVLCPTCHRLHHWMEKRRHHYGPPR